MYGQCTLATADRMAAVGDAQYFPLIRTRTWDDILSSYLEQHENFLKHNPIGALNEFQSRQEPYLQIFPIALGRDLTQSINFVLFFCQNWAHFLENSPQRSQPSPNSVW